MTSEAKIAANRHNATRSTGPRTAAGKARSRRNAFLHGLSVQRSSDDDFAVQLDELTDKFAAMAAVPREIARSAAEAQLEVTRVQRVKIETINRNVRQQSNRTDDDLSDTVRVSIAVVETISTLTAFDRYERRAISRRKKALCALERYQAAKTSPLLHPASPAVDPRLSGAEDDGKLDRKGFKSPRRGRTSREDDGLKPAVPQQTTFGLRWPRLDLADTFGFCFRWRPFEGDSGAKSTFRKSRSRQWLSAGEYQS
jgi:hypothetical protein